jgi:hypothetical protein
VKGFAIMQHYDLSTQFDARASFYGKARVEVNDTGVKHLVSYNTHVATIFPENSTGRGEVARAEVYGTYSQTTLRHIKEFLKQDGFKADNSKQIMADYEATK